MPSFKKVKAVVAVVALAVSGAAGTAAHAAGTTTLTKVCLSKDGEPTDRCMEATGLSLRMAPPGTSHRRGPAEVDLTVQVGSRDLEFVNSLITAGDAADEVQICIIDGANICPPEPLEFVWICITTGLLAGSDCPHPLEESADPIATIKLQSSGRR